MRAQALALGSWRQPTRFKGIGAISDRGFGKAETFNQVVIRAGYAVARGDAAIVTWIGA